MKRSLRWQFISPLFFLFVLTFAGLTFFLSRTFLTLYENNVRDNLAADSELFAADLAETPGFPETIHDLQVETDRFADQLQVRITVIRPDGVVLSDSEADAQSMENHLDRPEVQQALKGEAGYQIRYSATLNARLLYVAVPVNRDGEVVLVVRLARSLASIEAEMAGLNRAILISGIIALLALLGITYFNFQRLTQPLSKLSKAAGEISKGHYAIVPASKKGNEINELGLAFNTMSEKIKEQIETLQNEEGKLRNILMQMQDGVLIVAKDGTILSINPAAERMFGVEGDQTIGVQLIQALQYYQITELYEKILSTEKSNSIFIDLQPRKLFLQAIGSILYDPDGNSVLLLFQDITRQRQLELTRKDFVSNVSHELRTPLASLRALTETLQTGALDDPPAAHHFIELMEIEISKLAQMVDELLELSRIESGKVVLKRSRLKAADLVNCAVERMSMQAQRAGLELSASIPDGLREFEADSEQLEQVLINLIHNAIKFTPPGGKVNVSAHSQKDGLVFRVQDTGIGISEDNLPRIFERFFKADRARAGKGTGLGLSIARHVIEMHGGRIWVESEEGKGSSFFFSIPFSGSSN